jgi:hypothetical protein
MRSLASDASSAVNIILGVLGKAEPVEVKIKGELVQEAQCQRHIIWSHYYWKKGTVAYGIEIANSKAPATSTIPGVVSEVR